MELYIHIPFCVRKCGYCDFLSFSGDAAAQEAYMEALLREVRWAGKACGGRRERTWGTDDGPAAGQTQPGQRSSKGGKEAVETVFVGGGTPSVLESVWIGRLLEAVYKSFAVAADAEITIEANPGTLTTEKLKSYRRAGINRLSMGLQSMDNRELKELGRIHTAEEFLKNYYMAREAGFANINIDLMSALPGQTKKSWEETLRRTAELQPEHISAYSLMIEEGTPFWERYGRGQSGMPAGERAVSGNVSLSVGQIQRPCDYPPLPSEEEDRAMYRQTKKRLALAGYERYEISNYARPGYECRHNVGYWTRVPYVGLGLGAASFYEGERFSNVRDLACYISLLKEGQGTGLRAPWQEERQTVGEREAMEEFMFLGLRLTAGIGESDFQRVFARKIGQVYGTVLGRLTSQGLLEKTTNGWRLSEWGLDVSNRVLAEFLLEE
ncbi:MAG: radical SAM family heme chaperone HemW [Lachnospiraceae bacterium]|nr:radical SAM family heme chaperone HemW [Lachnospiraceae bacterium]